MAREAQFGRWFVVYGNTGAKCGLCAPIVVCVPVFGNTVANLGGQNQWFKCGSAIGSSGNGVGVAEGSSSITAYGRDFRYAFVSRDDPKAIFGRDISMGRAGGSHPDAIAYRGVLVDSRQSRNVPKMIHGRK